MDSIWVDNTLIGNGYSRFYIESLPGDDQMVWLKLL